MEGSFETTGGGMTGGSAMSGGTGGMGQDFGGETVFESGESFEKVTEVEAPKMSGMDYLREGVDKGFYQVETEGKFSLESVMSEAQAEMEQDEKTPDRQLMDIPGTAHEKLESLAQMNVDLSEKKQLHSNNNDQVERNISREINTEPETSITMHIMMVQAEAIKMIAKAMEDEKQLKKEELEELIKKLKKLLEESQAAGGGENKKEDKNGVILNTTLSLIGLMFSLSEKTANQLEEEASKN